MLAKLLICIAPYDYFYLELSNFLDLLLLYYIYLLSIYLSVTKLKPGTLVFREQVTNCKITCPEKKKFWCSVHYIQLIVIENAETFYILIYLHHYQNNF